MPISVVPVSEELFDDVQAVFGARGQAVKCQCQAFKMGWYDWKSDNIAMRRDRLREQVAEGHGLLAYLDGEPVGWCSLEPRTAYAYLRQTTWKGRKEDRSDASIWAVTCFVTRAGFRHQGVSAALATATPDFARRRGAAAVEAYPMRPAPEKEVSWGELNVGALSSFLAAGYRIVHEPSLRRAIVRYDF